MSLQHVLIVDDSKSARLVLQKKLQEQHLTVDMVTSGEEALEYLATKHPDAIFMDHTMPGMDGLQTTKAIKQDPRTAGIPIAMYTSKEDAAYAKQVQAYGAIGILPKPATAEMLSDIIAKLDAAAENRVEQDWNSYAVEPKSEPPANQEAKTPSVAMLEEFVHDTVVSVVDQAIQQKILPLLEEKLSALRENLLTTTEINTLEMVDKAYDVRSKELFHQILQETQKQIGDATSDTASGDKLASEMTEEIRAMVEATTAEITNKTAKEVAAQTANDMVATMADRIYHKRFREFSEQLSQHLDARFAKFSASLQTQPTSLDPKSLKEMRTLVQTIATDKATKIAQATAELIASSIANKTLEDINTSTKSVLHRINVVAGSLIVFCIATVSVVVYYFKQSL